MNTSDCTNAIHTSEKDDAVGVGSERTNSAKSNMKEPRHGRSKKEHKTEQSPEPIPIPPAQSNRIEHLRPSTPALTRSRTPSANTRSDGEKPARKLATASEYYKNKVYPWETPQVDALIASLDARGYDYDTILEKIESEFPQLKAVQISWKELDNRLQILDTKDAFLGGSAFKDCYKIPLPKLPKAVSNRKPKKKSKSRDPSAEAKLRTSSAEQRDHQTISRLLLTGLNVRSSLHEEFEAEFTSRGAIHGQAIASGAASSSRPPVSTSGNVTGPLSSVQDGGESSGVRHGRLVQSTANDDTSDTGLVPNSDNVTSYPNDDSTSTEHHRNQSNVSSNFTGTTAVIPPNNDEMVSAPEGLVYTKPAPSEPTTRNYSSRKISLPFPVAEDEEVSTRGGKLGQSIHNNPGQSHIPILKNRSPKKTSVGYTEAESNDDFLRKPSRKYSNKENKTVRLAGQSLEFSSSRAGPSKIMPDPLTLARSPSSATHETNPSPKKDRVRIGNTTPKRSLEHETQQRGDALGKSKVGNIRRPLTPYA